MRPDNSLRSVLFGAGMLIFLTIAVYSPAAQFEFLNYDDDLYVTQSPYVPQGLSREGLRWIWTASVSSNWHPLTLLSHMLDVEFFGMNPGAHHLVNVFLHAFNALLLFIILNRVTGKAGQAFFVAAFFALHPLHVESVAWISERKDLLSGLFFLLTLGLYAESARRQSRAYYWGAAACFVCGLMAKPMLVTLPFVLLLLDLWPLKRISQPADFGKLIKEKIPFFIFSVISCAITLQYQKQAIIDVQIVPLPMRILNALASLGGYLSKTFFPVQQSVFYPYLFEISPLRIIVSAGLLVLISIGVTLQLRRRPYLFSGWFWFLGMLVPVIGIVQVGSQAMADRYTYLPHIGLFMALVWGVSEFAKNSRWAGAALGFMILTALAFLTVRQLQYWRNSTLLFERALEVVPSNYIAHYNLGLAYQKTGRKEESRAQFMEASRLQPKNPDPFINLGNLFVEENQHDEAISYYRQALNLKPNHPRVHFNLGAMLEKQGKLSEAVEHYTQSLGVDANYSMARQALERVRRKQAQGAG